MYFKKIFNSINLLLKKTLTLYLLFVIMPVFRLQEETLQREDAENNLQCFRQVCIF